MRKSEISREIYLPHILATLEVLGEVKPFKFYDGGKKKKTATLRIFP